MTRPGQAAFHGLFVPALLAVALLPWLGPRAAVGGAAAVTAVALPVCILIIWMAEQLFPARAEWNARPLTDGMNGLRQLGRTLLYVFGITQVTALLITRASALVKPVVEGARMEIALWPSAAPFAARVLLAFTLAELASYGVHRAAHHFRVLWQFHSTHHVITELNALKAFQTHPVDDVLFHLGRTVPLLWLGAGVEEVVAALYWGGVLGVLSHANIRVAERGWRLFFNLPRAHAVHHSADAVEGRANFGCHTVFWDRVFGTFRPQASPELVVGVEPVGRRSLWQELIWPFYRRV